MTRKEKLELLIAGAIAAWGVYEIVSMPEEKRNKLFTKAGEVVTDLLDNSDDSDNKANSFLNNPGNQNDIDWIDVLYFVRKTLKNLSNEMDEV